MALVTPAVPLALRSSMTTSDASPAADTATLGDVVALSYRRVNEPPYGTCTYGIRTACFDFPVFKERTALMRHSRLPVP